MHLARDMVCAQTLGARHHSQLGSSKYAKQRPLRETSGSSAGSALLFFA